MSLDIALHQAAIYSLLFAIIEKPFYLSPKPITDFRGGDRMGFFVFRNTAMMISVKVECGLVQPVAYDAFGREAVQYLPYVSGEENGWFKRDFVKKDDPGYTTSDQYIFYNHSSATIAQDTHPYSETVFEPSPLNRPDKQYGAGAAWRSNDRFIQHGYLVNRHGTSTGQEKIIAWEINGSGYPVRAGQLEGYIETGGYYATGQLYVNSTKDEEGNEVREYTNKSGQIILKKVQAVSTSTPGFSLSNRAHWAQTYYVYDDFGSLRYVLPPELTYKIYQNDSYNPSTTAGTGDLDTWAFQYKYDGRRRMVEKKVPGADPVYMVYDKRDRLVLTQDGNQRNGTSKLWSFIKYDALNRPVLTGIRDTATSGGSNLTQAEMQEVVNLHYQKPGAKWSEEYVGDAQGNIHGYSNYSYPIYTTGTAAHPDHYLTATYYDNYAFADDWPDAYAYLSDELAQTVNGTAYTQPEDALPRIIGQITGTKTKVLDGGLRSGYVWLSAANYYDDRYRLIQNVSGNYRGGIDRVSNLYDFSGKTLISKTTVTTALVTWKDKVAVKEEGNRIYKTGSAGWNAGAASVQQLPAGLDGWMEFTASEINLGRMVGLSDQNTDANHTSLDYAFYLLATGVLRVYENGTNKTTISGGFKMYDRLKIARVGTTVYYYRNDALVYTSLTSSSTPLMVDISLNSKASTVVNVTASFALETHSIIKRFDYDHAGRLLNTYHTVDAEDAVILSRHRYNELGQLINKGLHSSNGTDYAQTVDYRYTIRGWLTSINDPAINPDGLFQFNLRYNDPTISGTGAQFNGNISQTTWRTAGGDESSYTYEYDPMNRLTEADYSNHTAPNANGRYNETIKDGSNSGYDLNGNIKKLQRYGKLSETAYGQIDDLNYVTYTGNQVTRIDDAVPSVPGQAGFTELTNNVSGEYVYDKNGNMILDKNKGISGAGNNISYNYLNLPEKVQKSTSQVIRYIYDATGRKLAQSVIDGALTKETDYVGDPIAIGFFYENDTLKFISHEEGRVLMTGEEPEYQYHLKDHLGNVRLTFTTKSDTELGTGTLEPENSDEEYATFVRYGNARKVQSYLLDRSKGISPTTTPGYAQRLSGGTNEIYGLGRSLSVMPGDTVRAEVYAKYIGRNETNPDIVSLLSAIATQIANGTTSSGLVIDSPSFGSSTASFPFPPRHLSPCSNTHPSLPASSRRASCRLLRIRFRDTEIA